MSNIQKLMFNFILALFKVKFIKEEVVKITLEQDIYILKVLKLKID
jgi:hypothetical protein